MSKQKVNYLYKYETSEEEKKAFIIGSLVIGIWALRLLRIFKDKD